MLLADVRDCTINGSETLPLSISHHALLFSLLNLEDRYNKAHLSNTTILVVDALLVLGMIKHIKGHFGRSGFHSSLSQLK